MKKLIRYDPDERILARQALKDPFFRELQEKKEASMPMPPQSGMLPSGGSGASATRSREQWFTKANSSASSTTSAADGHDNPEMTQEAGQTASSIGAGAEEGRTGGLPTIGQVRRKLGGGGGAGGAESEEDGPGQVLPPIGGLKGKTGRTNVKPQQTFKTAGNAALHGSRRQSSTQAQSSAASKTGSGMHGRGPSKGFGTTFGGSGVAGAGMTATSSKSNADAMAATNPHSWANADPGSSGRPGSNVVASMGSTWAPQRRR